MVQTYEPVQPDTLDPSVGSSPDQTHGLEPLVSHTSGLLRHEDDLLITSLYRPRTRPNSSMHIRMITQQQRNRRRQAVLESLAHLNSDFDFFVTDRLDLRRYS